MFTPETVFRWKQLNALNKRFKSACERIELYKTLDEKGHQIEEDMVEGIVTFFWIVVAVAVVLGLLTVFCGNAHADVTEEQAVRTIIGEAANQGEHGMVCVGEVLRRQGSLKGFYGYRAKHIDAQPAWVWKMARKAWRESAHTNYTKKADHFENVRAFGAPRWAKSCKLVYVYKDHRFYKEVHRGV